ncbi:MAG: aminopeptidase P family protein [Thermodesulfovibrio sp.]|nr:aminopeptidase P family protein [Thermodesulfovibrio sp.]
MANNFRKRIKKVLELNTSNSDAFLITNLKNLRYLTGFTGSFAVGLLIKDDCFLLVDFRYVEQAKKEARAEIIEFKNSWFEILKNIIRKKKIKRLSFEASCSYETFSKLSEIKEIELIPQSNLIENIRVIKENKEIESIKEAIKRAENAFLEIKSNIREGISERKIAILLEYEIKKQGAEELPFSVIVASGSNSSMPHWRNSDKLLKKGDFVIIDWGAEYKGYYSDITRTFIIGKASKKQIEIYNTVNHARAQAISSISKGIKAKKIDVKARNLIKHSGYGKNFRHATGHGVGMEIHEFPKINMQSEEIIQPGMVFTIEPGIYIEGFGGVRIEDMVVVRDNSTEILTTLSTDLEIL